MPYQYLLQLEISAEDAGVLIDGLEDEAFSLSDRIGWSEVVEQIRAGWFSFHEVTEERIEGFETDVEILSVYLSEYVVGREYTISPGADEDHPDLAGWKIVGRLGETVRLRLDLSWEPAARAIVDHDEDVDDVARRWPELPRWVQDAMRIKHPRLQAL